MALVSATLTATGTAVASTSRAASITKTAVSILRGVFSFAGRGSANLDATADRKWAIGVDQPKWAADVTPRFSISVIGD